MEQTAEFLGAGSQATEADAADRRGVVGHDRHAYLLDRAALPFVGDPCSTAAQQAGNDTFDHRAAVARGVGQLHLAEGAFAVQARGGSSPPIPVTRVRQQTRHCGEIGFQISVLYSFPVRPT